MPLISIVIPCYNQGRFLRECIQSLQKQTYSNWEAIIVNDGSKDNTREIALNLGTQESRIRYVEQVNKGLSGARNAGVANAKGVFLQFLDADDMLENRKLSEHIAFLQSRQDVSIVYGDVRYFDDGAPFERKMGPYAETEDKPWIPEIWKQSGSFLSKLVHRNVMTVNCPLIRYEAIKHIGFWNEKLNALEDWEYWIRCAAGGVNFHYHEAQHTHALVRMHQTSMTQDMNRMANAQYEFCLETSIYFSSFKDQYTSLLKGMAAIERIGSVGRTWRYLKLFKYFKRAFFIIEILKNYLTGKYSLLNEFRIRFG